MEITGRLEWTEYMQAQVLSGQRLRIDRRVPHLLPIVATALYAGSLALAGMGRVPSSTPFLVLALAAVFVIEQYVFFPLLARYQFMRQKSLVEPFALMVAEDGIFLQNEYWCDRWNWDDFVGWKESDALFLLYHPGFLYSIVPKRLLSKEQVRLVRARLRASGVPVVGSIKNAFEMVLATLFTLAVLGVGIFIAVSSLPAAR